MTGRGMRSVLQVSIDTGGNRGGGGSKGKKAPAVKSSEAKINDIAEPVEMPSEEINEKVPEEKPEPQDRADKKETADTAGMSASDAAAGNEGMNTQGDGSGSGGETAAEPVPVPVKVTAMEAGREPVFLLRRRQ